MTALQHYGHHLHRAGWFLLAILVVLALGNCTPKQIPTQSDKTYAVVDVGQTLIVEWPKATRQVKYLGIVGAECSFQVDEEQTVNVRMYTATSLPTGSGGMMDLHCSPDRPSGPVEVVVDETATISYSNE